MIEEIVQKPHSPVVTFPCRWDIKYPQVIDEVVRDLKFYYSKAQNLSGEFRDYLAQNRFSARGIKLHRIRKQKSSAVFYMLGRHKGKANYKAGNNPEVVGRLTLKRIIQSADTIMVTYHLTFEVKNFSVSGSFSADMEISKKEAEAFSEYAKSALGMNVWHTTKSFY